MKEALGIAGFVLGVVLAFFLVIGGFMWALAAITDANIDCPPGSAITYDNFGYISQCTVYPPSKIVVQ